MNNRSHRLVVIFSFIVFSAVIQQAPVIAGTGAPCGIFSLDSPKGGISSSGLPLRDGNIRDYPFVKGYAWRTAWPYIETSKGVYDFSALDHIIGKLESIDQELSLLILPGEPDYIKDDKEVLTWKSDHNPKHQGAFAKFRSGRRVVPWDRYLKSRFRSFIEALSEHQVYSLRLKQKVSLANHPTLRLINTGVPGYGALRENRFLRIAKLPEYSREKLKDSVLEALHTITTYFPNQNYMIGLWRLNDGQRNPMLSDYIRGSILSEFNGVKYPKVGFFQENLAASKNAFSGVTGYPGVRFAEPLYSSKNDTYIGFQALQGWNRPFGDPSKTANTTPADAIGFALETYNARYFELYVVDIDDKQYHESLTHWSKVLCSDNDTKGFGFFW